MSHKPDRTKLLTVIDDSGAVQLYFGRSLDDHALDYGGEFLFHRDGTVTFKSRTDDDTPIVTTIFGNRVVVAITEDQVGVTEDSDFPLGEVLSDTARLFPQPVLYRCELDRNGCGYEWRASNAGDVFLTCPACGKNAGAIV